MLSCSNARMRLYPEATTDSGVEVRDLAENGLVYFPLAVSTDDCEVRELSSLEQPRKWLEQEGLHWGGSKHRGRWSVPEL